jgi:predicted DNA-binding transcriptional regulator AlpA
MKTTKTVIESERLALSPKDAAAHLGISRAQFWKLHASGRLPLPIRLGAKKPMWVLAELRDWLATGAPPRDQWERTKREGRP